MKLQVGVVCMGGCLGGCFTVQVWILDLIATGGVLMDDTWCCILLCGVGFV